MTDNTPAVPQEYTDVVVHRSQDVMLQGHMERAVANIDMIRELQAKVMRPGVDYGVVPGTGSKPTLLKPGAETLLATFGLSALKAEVEITPIDHEVIGHMEAVVTINVIDRKTGEAVGFGTGSCSTLESKYRWRKGERVCPQCGGGPIIKGKAEYGGGWVCWKSKGGCGQQFPDGTAEIENQNVDRTENQDPADQRNTVLKMAKKRALVDAALTVTAASGIFTQDLEDHDYGQQTYSAPQQPREEARPQRKVQMSTPQPNRTAGSYPREDEIPGVAAPVGNDLDSANRSVNGDGREPIRILAVYATKKNRDTGEEEPMVSGKDGSPYRRFKIVRLDSGQECYATRWNCDWTGHDAKAHDVWIAAVEDTGKGYTLHGLEPASKQRYQQPDGDDYDIGEIGPPLLLDDYPLSPGD